MTEPAEGRREARDLVITDKLRQFARLDSVYVHYEEGFNAARDVRRENVERIQAGESQGLSEYNYGEEEYTEVGISIARRGGFVTRDVARHQHLARREVMGAVQLTSGDILAGAEWGSLPVFDRSRVKPHQLDELAELDRICFQVATQRHFALAKTRMSNFLETMDRVTARNPHATIEEVVAAMPSNDYRFARQSDVIRGDEMERLVYTMLARLSSHLEPTFYPEQSAPMEDVLQHTDMALVYEQSDEPYFFGLDVTAQTRGQAVWTKYIKMVGYGKEHHSNARTSPILERKLHGYGGIVPVPEQISRGTVMDKWRGRKGDTAITPEYFLTPEERIILAKSMLGNVVDLQESPLYSEDAIKKAVVETYGQ